jgi:hypothetical protein
MHPAQLQGDDHTQGCWNNNKEKKKKEREISWVHYTMRTDKN